MSRQLDGKHIALLAENDYEDIELHYPLLRLREEGAEITVVGPEVGRYQGKHGLSVEATRSAEQSAAEQFDALVVPGGYCPDHLRTHEAVLALVRGIDKAGKPLAAICHAPWVLCSAGVLGGRNVTSYSSIKDDVVNAGGIWHDKEVVIDRNLITSRFPPDLGVFCRAIIEATAG